MSPWKKRAFVFLLEHIIIINKRHALRTYTYGNPGLQSFTVLLLESHFDVAEIDFRPGHDYSNQRFVIRAHTGHTLVQTFREIVDFALDTFD